MAELRDRVLGPCALTDPSSGRLIGVDVGALLLRLLLFENNMLDSIRLGEIPHLVSVLGFDQVMALLTQVGLQINCDARTFGQTGQLAVLRPTGVLPLLSYSFGLVTMPDRDEYVAGCLHEMQASLNLPIKKIVRLKKAIMKCLIDPPATLGRAATTQLMQDLTDNREVARVSLRRTLEQAGHSFDQTGLRIHIEPLGDGDFRTTTNLSSYGIDLNEQHSLVERAFLGVGGLALRLDQMQSLQVISGFREEELPIFDAKLNFLAAQISPEAQADRLQRVVTLAGLPDPSEALAQGLEINIDKLLKVRESDECRDFRAWLRTVDQETDDAIRDRVSSLKAKTSEVFHSSTGRVIRFATVTGAGFVPVAGPALSIGLGVVDTFALDRMLGDPGPSAFLSKKYKSLFDGA